MRVKDTKSFIKKAKFIYGDKYNYSLVDYKKSILKVRIICPIHGVFEQSPNNHINSKSGCIKCGIIKGSSKKKVFHTNDRNWDFKQPEDYKIIPLTKGKFAKVDNDDFEKVKNINWCYTINDYAINDTLGLMHRFIMNTPIDMDTDHINHDKTDNRKYNLRICTRSENNYNQKIRTGYTSLYKGVSWSKPLKLWLCQITFRKQLFVLGNFSSEIEAAKAYDKKAIELFGEFAHVNFNHGGGN